MSVDQVFAEEVLTVSTAAVTLASVPTDGQVKSAQAFVDGAAVRVRFTEDPTGTAGVKIDSGQALVMTRQQAHQARFIRDDGASSDATVHVLYMT